MVLKPRDRLDTAQLTSLEGDPVGTLLGLREGDRLGLDVGTLHVESSSAE